MSDPTGTVGLRRSFFAEGNRRLARLRSWTHTILVERDVMAAHPDNPLSQLFPFPAERLPQFADWFERVALDLLAGQDWWSRFLQRGYESGAVAGRSLVRSPPRTDAPVPAVFRELAQREFAGIAAAMTQQVSRAAARSAISGAKPLAIYRTVLAVVKRIGLVRLKAAVNYSTVQVHNLGRLEQFRAAGVAQVGIVPELLELPRRSHFVRHKDHAHHFVDETRTQRAQRELEEAEAATEKARVALEQAQADLQQAEALVQQAEAKVEVAELKVQTEENEVANVEAEVAQADANLQAVESEDPETPAHAERVAYRQTMVERADAKLANAEERLEQAKTAADDARGLLDDANSARDDAQAAVDEARDAFNSALDDLREKQIAAQEAEDLVNVLTAGDDKVCVVCQGLADDGPYELDEAQNILPAHPNCRCSWIPADEE